MSAPISARVESSLGVGKGIEDKVSFNNGLAEEWLNLHSSRTVKPRHR